MKLFLIGLACAFVGFVIWFGLSVIYGISSGVSGKHIDTGILALPFLLMVCGPIVCWIILPLVKLFRRKK
jgi:hypothetical protein